MFSLQASWAFQVESVSSEYGHILCAKKVAVHVQVRGDFL